MYEKSKMIASFRNKQINYPPKWQHQPIQEKFFEHQLPPDQHKLIKSRASTSKTGIPSLPATSLRSGKWLSTKIDRPSIKSDFGRPSVVLIIVSQTPGKIRTRAKLVPTSSGWRVITMTFFPGASRWYMKRMAEGLAWPSMVTVSSRSR